MVKCVIIILLQEAQQKARQKKKTVSKVQMEKRVTQEKTWISTLLV